MSSTTKGAMFAAVVGCVVAPVVRLLDPATEEDEMFVRREFLAAGIVGALAVAAAVTPTDQVQVVRPEPNLRVLVPLTVKDKKLW